jgi:hypothetical protein
MSVYKRGKVYHYEFEVANQLYLGTTRLATEREAIAYERRKRSEVEEDIRAGRDKLARYTVREVFGRYWESHGKYLSWAPTMKAHMIALEAFFGPKRCLAISPPAWPGSAWGVCCRETEQFNRGKTTTRSGSPTSSTVNRGSLCTRHLHGTRSVGHASSSDQFQRHTRRAKECAMCC